LISTDNSVVDLVLCRVSHENVSIWGSGSVGRCEKRNVIWAGAQRWRVTGIDINTVKVLKTVHSI
jgi:hypothetical protein